MQLHLLGVLFQRDHENVITIDGAARLQGRKQPD